jgi:hypothetical protein
VDEATLASVLDTLPWGLVVTRGDGNRPRPYLNPTFALAELVPTIARADRALSALAAQPTLYPGGYDADGEAIVAETVEMLHAFFGAFGGDVVASIEVAASRARSPQITRVLAEVAQRLRSRRA